MDIIGPFFAIISIYISRSTNHSLYFQEILKYHIHHKKDFIYN